MVAPSSFQCTRCGDSSRLPDVRRTYETNDGDLPVMVWPVWCWGCDWASIAEYIPHPTEIIDEARAWRSRDRGYEYKIDGGPIGCADYDDRREPYVLEWFDRVMRWRHERVSPGKCLLCGSTRLSYANKQIGFRFEHPGCGGMITSTFCISGSVGWVVEERYSPEGEKVGERQFIA